MFLDKEKILVVISNIGTISWIAEFGILTPVSKTSKLDKIVKEHKAGTFFEQFNSQIPAHTPFHTIN